MMYRVILKYFTETGGRANNEDYIAFDRDKSIYVVCDGIGGHDGGEIASRIVAESIVRDWDGDIEGACLRASHALNSAAGNIGMGTTMAMAAISDDNVATLAHCGDSRIYLVRNGKILYQSADHVALTDSGDPIITRAFFSRTHRHTPDVKTVPLFPGDRILLCTDGVYGNGKWSKLRDLLTGSPFDFELVRELGGAAAHDNYSAIFLEIDR